MRVKARLTSDALEVTMNPPPDFHDNADFKALAVLFPDDPLIAFDEQGWYLSATSIDLADDSLKPGAPSDEAERLLTDINGTAMLLRTGTRIQPARFTGVWDGKKTGTSVRIYQALLYSTPMDHLSPESAKKLLALSASQPLVNHVLAIFQHADREWMWVDLWLIWDIIGSYFPKKKAFEQWVSDLNPTFNGLFYDFERSANDPSLGPDRRHALRNYEIRENKRTGQPGQEISQAAALTFIKEVAVKWIEKEFGIVLDPQFDHV